MNATPYLPILLISLLSVGTASPEVFNTDTAIQYALEHNRDIQVAHYAISQAKVSLKFSGKLENPEIEFGFSTDQLGEDEGEQSFEAALTQPLPLTSRRGKEKQWHRAQVHLAELKLSGQQLQLAHAVDQTLLQTASLQNQIKTQEKVQHINQEIVAFLKEQAARGEASLLDVTQASLTGRDLNRKLHLLEAETRRLDLEFKTLLGLPPETNLSLDMTLTLPNQWENDELTKTDLLQRQPEIRLAQAKIDAANLAVKLEKARRWDDASLRLSVEREESIDAPGELEENTIIGIGLSIPLPLIKRNNKALELAKVAQQAAAALQEALIFKKWTLYQQARQSCKDAYALARETNDDLVVLAEQNFDDIRHAYQQGQVSLLQVQQAQEQVLDIEASALDALTTYFQAAANLRLASADYPQLLLQHSEAKP